MEHFHDGSEGIKDTIPHIIKNKLINFGIGVLIQGNIKYLNPLCNNYFLVSDSSKLIDVSFDQLSPPFQLNGQPSNLYLQEQFEVARTQDIHDFNWICKNAKGQVFYCNINLQIIRNSLKEAFIFAMTPLPRPEIPSF